MKNKLVDLNDHLFTQLERLNEEGISEEDLNKEIKRGKVIASIAKEIINNGVLVLGVAKASAEGYLHGIRKPAMLQDGKTYEV